MKTTLTVLLFSVVLVLSGCGSGGNSACSFSGLTPNGAYRMFYTSNGSPYEITLYANAYGTISTYLFGSSCSSAVVVPIINSGLTLTANPSSIDLMNPPATVTITGGGFDATYGMPRIEYFDNTGFLVGSAFATYVSGDGTTLQANVPNLAAAYSGTYQIRVTNKTYQGYYVHIVGSAIVTAFGRDRLDSDGDGWFDDQDCAPLDPFQYTNCNETCGGGYGNQPPELCGPIS